jgi:hypothetical protein
MTTLRLVPILKLKLKLKPAPDNPDLSTASGMPPLPNLLSDTEAREMEIVLLSLEFSVQNMPEEDIILK